MHKMYKSFIISVLAFWPILLLGCGRREELKGTMLLEVLQRRGILSCGPFKERLRWVHSACFRAQRISLKDTQVLASPGKGFPAPHTRKSSCPSKDFPARIF